MSRFRRPWLGIERGEPGRDQAEAVEHQAGEPARFSGAAPIGRGRDGAPAGPDQAPERPVGAHRADQPCHHGRGIHAEQQGDVAVGVGWEVGAVAALQRQQRGAVGGDARPCPRWPAARSSRRRAGRPAPAPAPASRSRDQRQDGEQVDGHHARRPRASNWRTAGWPGRGRPRRRRSSRRRRPSWGPRSRPASRWRSRTRSRAGSRATTPKADRSAMA